MNRRSTDSGKPVVREEATPLSDSQAAALCALFGDGLESGMGYSRILEMMERQDFDEKLVGRLRQALQEDGARLGEAFARYGLLDPTARKLILVAEQQGTLPSTFHDLHTHYSKRWERRKKFVFSLVGPLILALLGLVLARNVVSGVMAAGTDVDVGEETPSLDAGDLIGPLLIESGIQIGLFGLLAGFVGYVYLHLPVEMPLRTSLHRLWVRLPLSVLNKSARHYSLAVFFRYLRKSISGGLTVHQALELAAEASNNPSIEQKIPIAQEAIEKGERLARALTISDAVPREAIDFVDVGEESGNLEKRLDELADRFEDRAQKQFDAKRKAMFFVIAVAVVVAVLVVLGASVMNMSEDLDLAEFLD